MRPHVAILTALVVAGCGESPAAPSSLEAKLLYEPAPNGPFVEVAPEVFVAEDAIVARTTLGPMPACHTTEAAAGRVRDVVLVTLTRREQGGFCEAFSPAFVVRIEVRPIPRGANEVLFYERVLDIDGKTIVETTPMRADLNLR